MRHVLPGLLALRLRSTPTLVPRFGVDPALVLVVSWLDLAFGNLRGLIDAFLSFCDATGSMCP